MLARASAVDDSAFSPSGYAAAILASMNDFDASAVVVASALIGPHDLSNQVSVYFC